MSQVPASSQRPNTNDSAAWSAYWKTQGYPWRTEPEIDVKRQKDLQKCLDVKAEEIYQATPFFDMQLSRADIEWLLAMLKDEVRPQVLSYADLREVNLRGLPMGGAYLKLVHLEGADLGEAHLEGAHLEGAYLERAHLERAALVGAHLEGAVLE